MVVRFSPSVLQVEAPPDPPTPTHPVEMESSIFSGLHLNAVVCQKEGSDSPYLQRKTSGEWLCELVPTLHAGAVLVAAFGVYEKFTDPWSIINPLAPSEPVHVHVHVP